MNVFVRSSIDDQQKKSATLARGFNPSDGTRRGIPVKIKRVIIKNFRGIKKLDLELTFPLTVFTGKNGAGKSSILDCLATLLSQYPGDLGFQEDTDLDFKATDVSYFDSNGKISISVDINGETISYNKYTEYYYMNHEWSEMDALERNRKNRAFLVKNSFKYIPALAVHYSVHRTVTDIPLQTQETVVDLASPFMAFEGAFNANSNFHAFFTWFRLREDLESERLRDHLHHSDDPAESALMPIGQYIDPQLQAVRRAVKIFTGLTDLRVRRAPLHMEVKKAGKALKVDFLSDGEKCLLALVGDLARRLAILSGMSGRDPLNVDGVVLIDEIDLHLHPAWQRDVLPKLVQTFPNCQFIVSTHSPQILSDVRPEAIFQLRQTDDGIEVSHPQDSFGQTSDRILEDAMGVSARPEKIKEDLRLIFDLISQKDLETAKGKIVELETLLGSDPDLVRANTLIRRYEVLGQ